MSSTKKILVIGSNGQIGTVLTNKLGEKFGFKNVIGSDLRPPENPTKFIFENCSVLDQNKLEKIIKQHNITDVYLLAAYLSAKGEKNIDKAWDLNMNGLLHVLNFAKDKKIQKIFWPSSIAVFGPSTPKNDAGQYAITEPTTIYGVSKLAGETLCHYYHKKFGIDIRSIRYPGLIGWESMPGGGTTDYAVDIFHEAIKHGEYTCFLAKERTLPMMYMNDAITATINIMDVPFDKIKIRTSYNLSSLHFSPKELEEEIRKHVCDFKIKYIPDERDELAQDWPQSIDDTYARRDWGWEPNFNLSQMVADIILNLKNRYKKELINGTVKNT
ncbi:MAG: NAD-dependent epimerase [Flavobacteriales bacterium]|nr:NAD-dependent epimerase [Flavobacteriales bacterium]|tara:strand:- start:6951 stop:7934 length:984 start_codon:yes stop_codon:yes gene_type:complete